MSSGESALKSDDLFSSDGRNQLRLNPRLPEAQHNLFTRAWREHVDGRFRGQVGIVTSGSSGEGAGRLIALSETALKESAAAVNEHLRATASDVWMKTLPGFHVGGLGILVRASLSGARVVESTLERWRAEEFFRELEDSSATLLSLVPTQLFDLVMLKKRAPSRLRAVVIGGGRLVPDLYHEARGLGWPVLPSYGLTECCSQVATASLDSLEWVPKDVPRLRPLRHVRVRISSEGAIEISSSALLAGQIMFSADGRSWFADPKRVEPDGDTWFQTEDRGRLGLSGDLVVEGRTVDFVKIGGEGVVISRLEERFEKLKLIRGIGFDAALLAADDPRLGARIVLITTGSEVETAALVEAFNRDVMPYEKIRGVHQVARIPRSALGKLLRIEALLAVGLKPLVNL